MGWSRGKGLGMKEDGEQHFIRISHKTDQKGMGYQERDDQWTSHANQFNSLLKSLDNSANASENESGGNDEENEVTAPTVGFGFNSVEKEKNKKSKSVKIELSGKSLEEMSKKSGVRVHYRKFTRSKDISKYSEKDLANIFGKKCIEENGNEIETGVEEIEPEMDATIQEHSKTKKNKMSKRNKGKIDESNESELATIEQEPEKKRHKKDKQSKVNIALTENVNEHESSQIKLEKKKKRSKNESANETLIVVSDENSDCEIVEIKMKKKKKKKIKKSTDESQPQSTEVIETENTATDKVSTKKKKEKKNHSMKISGNTSTSNPEVNINQSVPISNTEFINGILSILVNNNNNNSGNYSTALEQSNANNEDDEEMTTAIKINPNITMNEVFEINRYHAEMFRFVDLDGFPNANLSDLSGYGYNKEFELKISEKSKDQNKINDLWDYALVNKYGKEAIQTKKTKRYSIKHLKKKNVFMKL